MPLNSEQKHAVEYLEGPLLVLAGPGTGKTQLLSSKVKYILEKTDTNPQNILCLTYTENGAQNMRDRLFSMIGQAAGQVAIHTYHAFGSVILSAYKNYATNFDRNLDEPIATVAQYKIIRGIVESLPATDILRGDSIADIASTIDNAKAARLTADHLEQIAQDNIDITTQLLPKIQEPLGYYVPRKTKLEDALVNIFKPLFQVLTSVEAKEIAPGIFREANEYAVELQKLIAEQEMALADKAEHGKDAVLKPSLGVLTKWMNKTFERAPDGSYRFSNIIANKKLLSLSHIMQKYDAKLASEGLYDFSDMIEQAIKILKEDEGFRLTLAERYQYILLDEFQDTNRSQAELVNLLTDGVDSPSIMAVGDDDQAICEFQGANASNLYEFQQHYQAEYINLTKNYRSTDEVVALGRQIADQIENSFSKQNGVTKVLTAERNHDIKSHHADATVERHEFVSADDEYSWIAKNISELLKSGVKGSDIAIITPKHKYIPPLLPYLKSYDNIDIAYERRENLFEDHAISELFAIARFIYELSEEKQPTYRLLQILGFPFWGLNKVSVAKISARNRDKGVIERLEGSDDPDIQALAPLIAELISISHESPLEVFLDRLVAIKGFAEYYCQDSIQSFMFYSKLHSVRKALREYIHSEKPTLKDLIDFIDDYQAAGTALISSTPYQDSEDSVQIVTVQKSKGLEYGYTFVIAVDDDAWGKAKGNNNRLVLPANMLKIRHTGATTDERLRLLFVAVTRAKHHLYLTNSQVDFRGKNVHRLEYLGEYEEKLADDSLVIHSPKLNGDVISHEISAEEAKESVDLHQSWIGSYREREILPALKPLLQKNLEHYALSATHLTSFVNLRYSGPEEFFKRYILRADSEPADASLNYGDLIHAVFEAVTERGITDEEAIKLFEAETQKLQILEEEKQSLITRGRTELPISLTVFKDILRDQNAKAEVDLAKEKIHFENIPLTGKIDHLAINQEARTLEIYDFKTNHYKEEYDKAKWDKELTLFNYRFQLLFYKLLLNLSPSYLNYKVTKMHLLFVSPDGKDGTVHDLVYEPQVEDEEQLKNLIRAIYRQIKTLEFLERDDLYISANDKNGLKEEKALIEKLVGEL